jgi:hypothetical protein
MSILKQYIIQYEGPFGKDELQQQVDALNEEGFGFKVWHYDTIQGGTQHVSEEKIIEIAKKSTPIQIMRRAESFWEEIWRIKKE